MRIAWFSPLADSPLDDRGLVRSALYTREVLDLLVEQLPGVEIELFVADDDLRQPPGHWPMFHYLRIAERDDDKPFDLFVYHLEDHLAAAFVRNIIPLFPGVVVLHDLDLSRVGDRPVDIAALLVESSVAVVKNAHGVYDEQIRKAGIPVEVTTNPVCAFESDRAAARRTLGIGDDEFAVAFVGKYLIEDRLSSITGALDQPLYWLTAEGDSASRFPQVKPILFRGVREFRELLPAFDLLLAPKLDVRRDTPLALFFAWAAGVPTIGLDFGPAMEIPSCVMLRVEPGRGEVTELRLQVEELKRNAALREHLVQNARAYVELVCAPELVAADLINVFSDHAPRMRRKLEEKRAEYLLEERRIEEASRRVLSL